MKLIVSASFCSHNEHPVSRVFCSDKCLKAHNYFTKYPWPSGEKYPYCSVCDEHHGPEGGSSTACSNFNPHIEKFGGSITISPEQLISPADAEVDKILDTHKNTSKPNDFDNAMTAGLKQIAKTCESLPPWNPDIYDYDTGKHTDKHGVWSGCPEHEVGACCVGLMLRLCEQGIHKVEVDSPLCVRCGHDVRGTEDSAVRESLFQPVQEAVFALPTSEQQQLYEWMHNALGLRIR